MHMADALVSPAIGGTLWAASAGIAAYAARNFDREDAVSIPKMGVMGAFVFSAQMINFAIPGTGSSGHIGGGLLLTALLGPQAAFLTLASILGVQALFFADGGLLAYGCNLFNLGFFPCFIAYPLIFRPMAGKNPSRRRLTAATVLTAVLGLQAGAFSVVMETFLSGRTELPFGTFVLLMQPIHLAIGLVEGAVSAAILNFLMGVRPDMLHFNAAPSPSTKRAVPVLGILLAAALLTGGIGAWYASGDPDGLEWSIGRITGSEELTARSSIHQTFAALQEQLAILPDYGFRATDVSLGPLGTSVSGLSGILLTMAFAACIGLLIRRRIRKPEAESTTE